MDSNPSTIPLLTSEKHSRIALLYSRLFSLHELQDETILKWFFGATLFSFFVTFNGWIRSGAITIEAYAQNTYSCWPYFQNCGELYFLSRLPYGYSQSMLYMILFGALVLSAYYAWQNKWVAAHVILLGLCIWKALVLFVFSMTLSGNYDYYHIVFTCILLFLPHKLFFLRLSFVWLYFLAGTIKIHEGWVLGTYFSSLKTGLPIFPQAIIPLVTNFVIFMQIVGSWFLLSKNNGLREFALFYFITFHLYSGIVVEYHYPAMVLPELLILFGLFGGHTGSIPLTRKSVASWTFIAALLAFQAISIFIPGDTKRTLEGNQFGLYMFEANHQCISHEQIFYTDGTIATSTEESAIARNRCDPYRFWFTLKEQCKRDEKITRIAWQFDHSINGGPFFRMVDEKNACDLEYKTFSRNIWIKLPEKSAIIGYPVKNIYY
jgi:hypothetical protein